MLGTLLTVLAAAESAAESEPSKTAFYIIGPIAAVWAVVVSVMGFTRPDFPGSESARRAVMGITVLVVLGAMSTAVITS
jgi:hypothetical protein